MDELNLITTKIRDILFRNTSNDKLREKLKGRDFNILTSGLDVIEDTLLALDHFQKCGIGTQQGEKYLKLYGLFQAIYIQQDAIIAISKIFNIDISFSGIARNLRNKLTGHPVLACRGKSSCFICRGFITDNELNIIETDHSSETSKYEKVNLTELIDEYKIEAVKHLKFIYNYLWKNLKLTRPYYRKNISYNKLPENPKIIVNGKLITIKI